MDVASLAVREFNRRSASVRRSCWAGTVRVEPQEAARNKAGDLVMILLGGRGAQALYRLLGKLALTNEV